MPANGEVMMMDQWRERFDRIDVRLTRWMARYGIVLLRISLGLVFLWFGFLKFFPGLSPAEELVTNTINRLSFGLIPPATAAFLVAALETLIGLGLITGVLMRVTLLLLAFQMVGTAMPIFLFPDQVFQIVPFVPTLEGQYIFKNLVLISAGLVIGATVRGGRLVAEPINDRRVVAERRPIIALQPIAASTRPDQIMRIVDEMTIFWVLLWTEMVQFHRFIPPISISCASQ
jgi:uncharacterized membrane protein YphA (DoxX/SURF4 family)